MHADGHPAQSGEAPELPATAWETVRGGYDLHVHAAPDLIRRSTDDVELARAFRIRGLRGFALKSHYAPTADRAAAVRRAVPGVEVIGTITLNHGVGGLNPVAVEIAGRSGARIVWLPTVDALNEARDHGREMAKPPLWVQIQRDMAGRIAMPVPISVLDGNGRIKRELRECLEIIAHYDMILATGHLSRSEIFAVVDDATACGVRHVVVTHPDFPTVALSPADQVRLAETGAILEHCFTTFHTGKAAWETCFANIRATGVERCIIATDLGQPSNPPVVEGLALFAHRLLEAGFSEAEVRALAVTNPARLAAPRRAEADAAAGREQR
jgi:hypothetical protein